VAKRTALRAAILLTLTVLVTVESAPATHRWVRWHWARARNPFTLGYRAQVGGPWGPLVAPVMNRWDNVSKMRPGTRDFVNWVGGSDLVIESGNYGATGWFGVARVQVNFVTGHISSGQVQLNDYYFTGQYNNDVARRHVFCQEVGHILGLDHNKIAPVFGASCMDDTNTTLNRPQYQYPNAHDAGTLQAIYKHSDSGPNRASVRQSSDGPLGWITVHVTPA
jgi:hypothetical protein